MGDPIRDSLIDREQPVIEIDPVIRRRTVRAVAARARNITDLLTILDALGLEAFEGKTTQP